MYSSTMDTWAVQLNAAMILVKTKGRPMSSLPTPRGARPGTRNGAFDLHTYVTSNNIFNISEADCDNFMDFSHLIEEHLFFSVLWAFLRTRIVNKTRRHWLFFYLDLMPLTLFLRSDRENWGATVSTGISSFQMNPQQAWSEQLLYSRHDAWCWECRSEAFPALCSWVTDSPQILMSQEDFRLNIFDGRHCTSLLHILRRI